MRRSLLVVSFLFFAINAFAAERWIPIAGTVNNFRTDTRVMNPSATKDIEVSATLLATGNGDNSGRVNGTPVKFTVKKREMKLLDDVVASLFGTTGIGGILLRSEDDFLATSRIYATVPNGTLGQFSVAPTTAEALTKGSLLQLQSSAAFRTNIGAVNTSSSPATVKWVFHDKTSAIIARGETTMPPYAVIGPTNMASTFFVTLPGGADISNAYVSFTSTQPIFVYGSIVDNGTTDQTFSPALNDSGSDPDPEPPPPPPPTTKNFNVTLQSFEIIFTPEPTDLKVGDKVKLTVHALDSTHGFQLFSPTGTTIVPSFSYTGGGASRAFEFTITAPGTYTYLCTISTCGVGHNDMNGTFSASN
ncbi:MAG TPA: hypothetical protein VFN10_07660 [Thermoanaerobaculia bacterium]|nr:hypothetical protein [Thermoanaerobaculia bacterium]